MSKPLDVRQYSHPKGTFAIDAAGNIAVAGGTGAPTDSVAGYAVGCLWLRRDGGANTGVYVNAGTATSSTWKVLPGTVLAGLATLTTTVTELNLLSGLLATATEINRNNQASTRDVAGGSSLTVTQALHDGKTIKLDTVGGTAVTLPAMTGSGSRFRFVCTVTMTSATVITATGAHLFGSLLLNNDTAAAPGFTAIVMTNAGGSTTISLDGTTKGGRKGDWVEIEDVATSVGIVRGFVNASGTEASPFA